MSTFATIAAILGVATETYSATPELKFFEFLP